MPFNSSEEFSKILRLVSYVADCRECSEHLLKAQCRYAILILGTQTS